MAGETMLTVVGREPPDLSRIGSYWADRVFVWAQRCPIGILSIALAKPTALS
jgi:hypothetical protein